MENPKKRLVRQRAQHRLGKASKEIGEFEKKKKKSALFQMEGNTGKLEKESNMHPPWNVSMPVLPSSRYFLPSLLQNSKGPCETCKWGSSKQQQKTLLNLCDFLSQAHTGAALWPARSVSPRECRHFSF